MTMHILDRYIGRAVGFSTLLVMGVLLTLFAFFAFMDEAGQIGKGNYGTWQAFQYVLLTVPGLAYQLFPICALLGTTIGLGILASNSELIVMRAAGVSLSRIILSVMKVGLFFVILTLVVGEAIAPAAERYAQTLRSVAMSDKLTLRGREGLWARDGNSFVNVRDILPGQRLGEIFIYERDESHRLIKLIQADSAVFRSGHWVLQGVVSSDIGDGVVTSSRMKEAPWETNLSPDLLSVVTVKPNTLSIVGLYQYVQYLKDNGLDADVYQQALWNKLVAPIVTAVMVFLSIPFVFGPLRSVGIGHRILVGSLAGVGFYIVNQMFAYMGLVFGINPTLSALAPAALAFIIGYLMLRRVY
ncbi:MAG: LPS export ABC transporter permease LptG [Ectothiorhodospiraceae bacterium]|nr:LPS export ABC transporter permease LptG [Ectothiorhodospiraceae bacterium]